ncbi:conserved phage C-terminal domain-containing protein [Bythopirellula polymerisocia]|uniref:Uncharacterized protein n=1 Tax=Bythopirellula polymerisocia TaxID=2528003 RepID=A0A5C6CU50_9BACT|nr:conserved phage C-terminal domain-containing protein [Bythopirellula polymerisocia]TWU27395.1 hypothetical protein Pla144_21680 [Bythopirellula polymerisocia]
MSRIRNIKSGISFNDSNPVTLINRSEFKAISDVAQVAEHYRSYHPRCQVGEKEKKLIRARFNEGYSAEDLKLAIDGCHKSPFHCGQNSNGRKYQTLELIFRNASKVNQFIELAGAREVPLLSEKSHRSHFAIKSWIQKRLGGTNNE